MAGTFINPIVAGGHPDPSVCRDGENFYMVNSTFEYYPGLPVHHSTDLVNWELIGYGLHRPSQVSGPVNLLDVQSDGGIHAPTIRCHDGKFYIITTNVYLPPGENQQTRFVNFIITADNPAGPWSEPFVIDGAPGIDPDLFFDKDGSAWYVGTHSPEKPNFDGEGEIWLQQLDLEHMRLVGERNFLWRGACGGVWAEGPHMYRRDGRYYLLVAEGGTSFNHAVVIAVSDEITGPYVSNDRNPILTSRHLSYDHWVNSTGHADMIELADGRWYMVALGIRNDEQRGSNMGRETHLIPMQWEREPFWWKKPRYEWPVVAPVTGRVERHTPLPFDDKPQHRRLSFHDDFDNTQLGLAWNFRRLPLPGTWSLTEREGFLRLFAKPRQVEERGRASLMGFRQTESDFSYTVKMQFTPENDGAAAGLSLFQKDTNFIHYLVSGQGSDTVLKLQVAQAGPDGRSQGSNSVVEMMKLSAYTGNIILRVVSGGSRYRYEYSLDDGESFNPFSESAADLILSKGYTGAYLGLFATGKAQSGEGVADFDWVSYRGFER